MSCEVGWESRGARSQRFSFTRNLIKSGIQVQYFGVKQEHLRLTLGGEWVIGAQK